MLMGVASVRTIHMCVEISLHKRKKKGRRGEEKLEWSKSFQSLFFFPSPVTQAKLQLDKEINLLFL